MSASRRSWARSPAHLPRRPRFQRPRGPRPRRRHVPVHARAFEHLKTANVRKPEDFILKKKKNRFLASLEDKPQVRTATRWLPPRTVSAHLGETRLRQLPRPPPLPMASLPSRLLAPPARPPPATHLESGPSHTRPRPTPRPRAVLTLLLRRGRGAPALAPRAAALLGCAALWLQVLWGWRSWLWGDRVLSGGLVDFGDLPREAGEVSIFTGRLWSTEMRGKPCRPPAPAPPGAGAGKRQEHARGTQVEGQEGRSL